MVFTPPAWVPQLPFDPPDSIPLHEFIGSERYGRLPLNRSQNPFTCGLTGKTYTHAEMRERHELLARSLSKRMGWRPNEDTPWDKVIGLFSLNTIDYLMSTFAVHRLSGIVTPANAMYSAAELEHQLKSSGSKALFTCPSLLDIALKAARASNIPDDKIFLLDVPGQSGDPRFKTIDDLIAEGRSLPELEPLKWTKGQGARQAAYLCYSSGTSGLPKAVMIAHRNIIANAMQIRWHEEAGRQQKGVESQRQIGLLPMSHIYALVVVVNTGAYRGDGTIVLPRFELKSFLECIQKFKINMMHIVPPIIIQLLRNPELCSKYDLSSVRFIYTGAAPLGAETHEDMLKAFPHIVVGQGYGMTETSTVVLSTAENDIMIGTSGSLVPGTRAKLLDEEGHEITEYDKRGELLIQSPLVPDEAAGEVPKAFVVKSASVAGKSDEDIAREICKYVEEHKARYKWLKGGVEFVDVIPKSPSGKILRRLLKDKEREVRRAKGAKL
ncbi:hypothetical protein NUW58_g2983 [Xylaria curta]|uniref:Uncharacterized protein n=1 Tax=Xylaria curta TaxID=42375 RepID=A0ACC1PD07_9PEZI|nr:hypothetical protein NUW58_g2983 [Xylaria curta]